MIRNWFVLILALIFISCENPFLTYLDGEDNNSFEPGGSENLDYAETSVVQILVENPFKDITVNAKRNGFVVELAAGNTCETYEWVMGSRVLGREQSCIIDFTDYSRDSYTVELYACNKGLIYSALCYITRCENLLQVNASRSIIPSVSASALSNLQLSILNNSDGSEEVFSFDSGAQLEKQKIMINEGNYTFVLTGEKASLRFSGMSQCLIERGVNKVTIKLQLSQISDGQTSSFSIKAGFPSDTAIDDVSISLMKLQNSSLITIEKISCSGKTLELSEKENGRQFVEYSKEKLEGGIYYCSLQTYINNYKKKGEYSAYIYILPGAESKKTVEINHFCNIYSVTYNLNEGFYIGEELQEAITGTEVFELPSAEEMYKPGFCFNGWYANKELTIPAKEIYEPGEIQGGLTFFADWKEEVLQPQITEGVGLLSGRGITVFQVDSELVMQVPLEQSAHIYTFDVYDSNGKICQIQNKRVENTGDCIETRLEINMEAGKYYLIETKAFNNFVENGTNMITKQFWEKQVLKALSN